MELVQGVPITDFCNSNKLTIPERLSLFITVCNAVHHAHQKGIIHRDLKPNNVMVTEHDGEPVVKVIDFGVAKALHQTPDGNQHQHQNGVIVGTPQYMSPEQAGRAGFDVDTRSDVFSLSVLLYELLTGSTPLDVETLQAADFQETLRLIQQVAPASPSARIALSGERLNTLAGQRGIAPRKLLRVVNGDLDCIVMKGLEKKRRRRYETARELAMDVQRYLTDRPVLARPPSLAYQSKKFVSRNRIGLIIGATAACALVAMLFAMVNHRRHQLAAVQHAENRLNIAVDEANSALLAAIEASDSSDHWATVDLMASQVAKLANDSLVGRDTRFRSEVFLQHFNEASQNREFASSMEALLVNFSTKKQTVESLTAMEQGFRRILRNRGYDLDTMSASEIAVRLKSDHAPIKLTDALELWLSTRIKLGTASDNEMTAAEIKAWTEAMTTADPNPLRTAIRATIFGTRNADVSLLDQAVADGDLKQMCARKLSWLSQAYQMVGEAERSAEILDDALAMHSNDLMLNFEHAVRLMDQKRTGDAIRYLMRCTSIRPGNASVWKKLAIAFWQNNEKAQAIKAIKKATELDPNDPESRLLSSNWLSQKVDNYQ